MKTVTPSNTPPVVVLVDDDRALGEAVKFSLETEGYCVDVCESAEALGARALPRGSACLVLDYKLDGLDGMTALERLRRRGVDLPAILITSYANALLRARAKRARAEVVEKPLLGDALLDRIHALAPLP